MSDGHHLTKLVLRRSKALNAPKDASWIVVFSLLSAPLAIASVEDTGGSTCPPGRGEARAFNIQKP